MKILKYAVYSLLIIGTSSCQDVVDLDVPEGRTRLVVDGMLTDQHELQTVKLKYTAPYFSNASTPVVSGANVYITDDLGAEQILVETAPGIYQQQFSGEIGRTYQLTVETTDGQTYRSLEEPLSAVSPIDTIYYEFEEESLYNEDEGYYVTIATSDPEGKDDFYRWRYYVNGERQVEPQDLIFTSDEYFDGNEGLTIYFGNDALLPGDTARVEQLSTSENAYNFLSLLGQVTNGGSQFDPPPAPVKGNMVNIDDANDFALGYFMVTAVVSEEIIIKEIEQPN